MRKLMVTVHDHGCAKRINPGFQNPQRPSWYLATQEAIVPREPFFAQIANNLISRCGGARSRISIFEPGVGLGSFFHYLLARTDLAEHCELNLIGADISEEMVRLCRDLLSAVVVQPGWRPVSVELHSRLDLLSLSGAGLEQILQRGPFDVVVASQFEHSYPNHRASALAVKFAAEGIRCCPKHDFRRFVREQLLPDGVYWAIDDYLTGHAATDQAQTIAWDTAVVRRLADRGFIRMLSNCFPGVAASLERRYDPSFGEEVLLKKVAHARQRRRFLCNEETETLADAVVDLQSIFGSGLVALTNHSSAAHRQFYLLRARRAEVFA